MPRPREWTAGADEVIRAMRKDGETWAAIGRCLGLSRNTVIERGRRLRAEAPPRKVESATAGEDYLNNKNRDPLPAGHRLTWGLLTDAPFPKEGNYHVADDGKVGARLAAE